MGGRRGEDRVGGGERDCDGGGGEGRGWGWGVAKSEKMEGRGGWPGGKLMRWSKKPLLSEFP